MKKRLRKKQRRGEFRELCFDVAFEISECLSPDAVESITDHFIAMIEDNHLQFGGGGKRTWTGVVQGPHRGSVSEADRDRVLQWLRDHDQILRCEAGPLRDAWYGWSP